MGPASSLIDEDVTIGDAHRPRTKEFPCAHAQHAPSSRPRRAHSPVRDPSGGSRRRDLPGRGRRRGIRAGVREGRRQAEDHDQRCCRPSRRPARRPARPRRPRRSSPRRSPRPRRTGRSRSTSSPAASRRSPPTKTTKAGYAEFSVPTKKGAVYKATAAALPGAARPSPPRPRKNTWRRPTSSTSSAGRDAGQRLDAPRAVLQPRGPAQLLQGRPGRRRRHRRRAAAERDGGPGARGRVVHRAAR